ncbi:MAG: hypothetical protein O2821_05305 [Chloroflexi bacterium]|nr:hypothetical protein [Chloroflexota bacterium]MDA1228529.1 hypothetical protein [Chloroflexota bacterium]
MQSASVPPIVVEQASEQLADGVSDAATLLTGIANAHPGAAESISEALKQQDGDQTRRMAMAILANALVFHESLARGPGELANVRTLDELKGMAGGLRKSDVLHEWRKILEVNYWPIFDIARRILQVIPSDRVGPLMERLVYTALSLTESNLMRSHDLNGEVFQRLIADRKFLAAFYTMPSSAALLVGLAIRPDETPAGGPWSDPVELSRIRVADFACGTGTLLSTAYKRIGQLHEAAGGDSETLHPAMMASALTGCDVLPAAAHLTASMLAGAHPRIKYDRSSVLTVPYGRRPDVGVALGSLDLLDAQTAFDMLHITATAMEGMGEREQELWAKLPHASFDVVIMNPPFTRDTTGRPGGRIDFPNPMFAAFGSTAERQREMAKAANALLKGTSAHGNAGEASGFLVLADRKLRDGGTLALVMPLSLAIGDAWEASRQLLRKSYCDVVFVSIAGARDDELSFSADTGMGECLVVARKVSSDSDRATFVVLDERPRSQIVGSSIADQIHESISMKLRKLEDGPVGGTSIRFGDDVIGHAVDAPIPDSGPWNLVRMKDVSLGQVAYQLTSKGIVWLPGMAISDAIQLAIADVEGIAQVGPYHLDISGNTNTGGIRGPFQIERLKTATAPTYPVMWAHQANREPAMQFEADSEGIIRKADDPAEDKSVMDKAGRVWASASNCHFNTDFRFNSQSTAMQFTSRSTIGGRAWPSIKMHSSDDEKVLTLWANSTLGLLLHWWHANKQQAGRGGIGVSALRRLPVLNVSKLSERAKSSAVAIFEDMKHRELKPINEIDRDANRHEIDRRFLVEVLGAPEDLTEDGGPLWLLRQKLALEPSIHGGKVTKS